MTAPSEICFLSLRSLTASIRAREISAREVMTAQLEQIRRWNPKLNAIVAKLDDESCLRLADAADDHMARGGAAGKLHGVPWAFKDLEPAIGFPWSRGSTIFRDEMPAFDSVLVERLRQAGVVPIGKTNTPEFGMGGQSYNSVYGTTRNPYDQTKSAGGSSGGGAAAVACGMLAGADGSDLGGSLRNPASFNNIVGLRPSAGLVPLSPTVLPFYGLLVKGPMARSVSDVAYLLDAMVGSDHRDPASVDSLPDRFTGALDRDVRGTRIAWCPDLGRLPLDRRVREVIASQRQVFESLGCRTQETAPDLSDAEEVFLALRAFRSWIMMGPLLKEHRAKMKPEAVAEIEAGARVSSAQIASALLRQGEIMESMRRFYENHDFIVCAATQTPPLDASCHWPVEVDGRTMEHYMAWMRSLYWMTATANPAVVVPAGFTAEGLPVGIQIVGRYRDDWGTLQLAHAFEQAAQWGRRRPAEATRYEDAPSCEIPAPAQRPA
jgi:amidase